MRAIHIVHLDKARPAVVLTREAALDARRLVTVAPITSRIRGLRVEVPVGVANGLDRECVVNCDTIATVAKTAVGRRIGLLFGHQEKALALALIHAFDLSIEELD